MDSHQEIEAKNKHKDLESQGIEKVKSLKKSKYFYTKKFGLDIQQINLTSNMIKTQIGGGTT